jgi:hypothetical protein
MTHGERRRSAPHGIAYGERDLVAVGEPQHAARRIGTSFAVAHHQLTEVGREAREADRRTDRGRRHSAQSSAMSRG